MQGRHTFDRKHWNALMTAECIKSLIGRRTASIVERTMPRSDLVGIEPVVPQQPVVGAWSSI